MKKGVIAAVVLAIAVLWLYPKVKQFFDMDECLDIGGIWDPDNNICVGKRPD